MTRLGRSPYRVEAGVLVELQNVWLAGNAPAAGEPVDEHARQAQEHADDLREQLAELRRREREEVDERRDELVAALREHLREQHDRDPELLAQWLAAASLLPGPEEARQAFDFAARADEPVATATVALRAVTERWDAVFVEWCGRFGWPQDGGGESPLEWCRSAP